MAAPPKRLFVAPLLDWLLPELALNAPLRSPLDPVFGAAPKMSPVAALPCVLATDPELGAPLSRPAEVAPPNGPALQTVTPSSLLDVSLEATNVLPMSMLFPEPEADAPPKRPLTALPPELGLNAPLKNPPDPEPGTTLKSPPVAIVPALDSEPSAPPKRLPDFPTSALPCETALLLVPTGLGVQLPAPEPATPLKSPPVALLPALALDAPPTVPPDPESPLPLKRLPVAALPNMLAVGPALAAPPKRPPDVPLSAPPTEAVEVLPQLPLVLMLPEPGLTAPLKRPPVAMPLAESLELGPPANRPPRDTESDATPKRLLVAVLLNRLAHDSGAALKRPVAATPTNVFALDPPAAFPSKRPPDVPLRPPPVGAPKVLPVVPLMVLLPDPELAAPPKRPPLAAPPNGLTPSPALGVPENRDPPDTESDATLKRLLVALLLNRLAQDSGAALKRPFAATPPNVFALDPAAGFPSKRLPDVRLSAPPIDAPEVLPEVPLMTLLPDPELATPPKRPPLATPPNGKTPSPELGVPAKATPPAALVGSPRESSLDAALKRPPDPPSSGLLEIPPLAELILALDPEAALPLKRPPAALGAALGDPPKRPPEAPAPNPPELGIVRANKPANSNTSLGVSLSATAPLPSAGATDVPELGKAAPKRPPVVTPPLSAAALDPPELGVSALKRPPLEELASDPELAATPKSPPMAVPPNKLADPDLGVALKRPPVATPLEAVAPAKELAVAPKRSPVAAPPNKPTDPELGVALNRSPVAAL